MATWESQVICSETYVSDGRENYSNVTITMQIRRIDYNMVGYNNSGKAYYSITCDGKSSGNKSLNFNWNNNKAGTWWTVGSHSFTIPHGSDGSKKINFSGYFSTGISPASFSANGSASLTKIPRYAKVTTFKCAATTQTSATIQWAADASCDQVYYSLNGGNWIQKSGTSFQITGLAPETPYTVKLRVRRSDSKLTTDTSPISFKTLPIASLSNTSLSCNIGGSLSLNFSNYNNNVSFLRLFQKNISGDWEKIGEIADIRASSYSWNLSSFSDEMYRNTPNSNTSEIKIVCGTTIGGIEYTKEVLGIAHVTNSNPSFNSFLFTNTDDSSVSLLGNSTSMITYYGNMQVIIPTADKAIPKNHSRILYYNVAITDGTNTTIKRVEENSGTLSIDFGNYQNHGVYNINVEAVDSRGNISNIVTKSFTVYKYHDPSVTTILQRINNFEKEVSLSIAIYISRVRTTTNKNSLKYVYYRFKESNSDVWSERNRIVPYTTEILEDDIKIIYSSAIFMYLDNFKSYDFEFEVEDKLQTVSVLSSVGQGIPVANIIDNGKVIINDIPSEENLSRTTNLIVGSDITVVNKENGERVELLDRIKKKYIISEFEPTSAMNGDVWCKVLKTIQLSDIDT